MDDGANPGQREAQGLDLLADTGEGDLAVPDGPFPEKGLVRGYGAEGLRTLKAAAQSTGEGAVRFPDEKANPGGAGV